MSSMQKVATLSMVFIKTTSCLRRAGMNLTSFSTLNRRNVLSTDKPPSDCPTISQTLQWNAKKGKNDQAVLRKHYFVLKLKSCLIFFNMCSVQFISSLVPPLILMALIYWRFVLDTKCVNLITGAKVCSMQKTFSSRHICIFYNYATYFYLFCSLGFAYNFTFLSNYITFYNKSYAMSSEKNNQYLSSLFTK